MNEMFMIRIAVDGGIQALLSGLWARAEGILPGSISDAVRFIRIAGSGETHMQEKGAATSNCAQGNSEKHKSMMVESNAYTDCSKSTPKLSLAYSGRAMTMRI